MNKARIIKQLGSAVKILFIALLAAICAAAVSAAWALSQPKGRVSCASFGSYNDALRAYTAGATWIDGDHDGRPCETRFPASEYGE